MLLCLLYSTLQEAASLIQKKKPKHLKLVVSKQQSRSTNDEDGCCFSSLANHRAPTGSLAVGGILPGVSEIRQA
jgi:hypothetical protein